MTFRSAQTCLTVALLCLLLFASFAEGAEFMKGVDLSVLKAAEDGGVRYKMDGKVADPLLIFKANGCNCVRLRLFVNPPGGEAQVNTLEYTLALAKQVKKAGLQFYLDFHYSDIWADPGHQIIPAQWKDLNQEQLAKKVHDYTLETLARFKKEGCEPNWVSVGNEITNGMMWPAGGPLSSEKKWPAFLELLKAGVSAVRESSAAGQIKIIIHVNNGGSEGQCEWFFDHCQAAGLDYDVIGVSYYPFWHGGFDGLAKNLAALSSKYHKPILVAETDYNFAGDQGKLSYPSTPEGQKAFLEHLFQVVASTPGNRGLGVCYWEPAWIQTRKWYGPAWSDTWEQRALFDNDGNALPGLATFKFEP